MDTGQLLTGVFLSNRDDQSPTYRQLLFESFRNSRSACCNTDAIERGRFRPPQRTVSTAQIHLAEPGAVKIQPGLLYQLRNPLDRKYLQCHAGQHGRRITGSRANVEYALPALQCQSFRHQRNNVGLRNRLAMADGQRMVCVSLDDQVVWHEDLSWHLRHHFKYPFVTYTAPGNLVMNH